MKIRDLIDDLKNVGEGETVSLGDILQQLQGRSLGVLLTLIALLNLIPFIGVLPGIPAITGTLLIVIAVQSLFSGRSSLWLPEKWRSRTLSRHKLESGLETIKPWFVWLDRIVSSRFKWLVNRYAAAICVIFLALMFFPLSFIPWGVDVPAIAVLLIGLSLIGRDGIIAVLGYAFSLFSLWFVWTYAPVAYEALLEWIAWALETLSI